MNDTNHTSEDTGTKIYTVTGLTEIIKDLLESRFDFVWIEAEISNFSSPASGHYYMALKDENAVLRAVMFRPQIRYLKFRPENGMKVLAQGRISVYQPRGEYQIILDYIEPLGIGALAHSFEQLKKKLSRMGLFDKDIKRPLPFLPQKIAVITSPTGAAIRDFLKIMFRRFANMEIVILPVMVQGDTAAEEMIEALRIANREIRPDIIVLTRGGGSMEDLWAFNDENLAYAIRESRTPVVSAVGHEIDITISDLVADLRAPTPSAAAELLVVEKEGIMDRLGDYRNRLVYGFRTRHGNLERQVLVLRKALKAPGRFIDDSWMRLDDMTTRLIRIVRRNIRDMNQQLASENRALLLSSPVKRLDSLLQRLYIQRRNLVNSINSVLEKKRLSCIVLEGKIKELSPLSVLKRGYSITRKLPDEEILRDTSIVASGDRVNIILAEGELNCLVEEVE